MMALGGTLPPRWHSVGPFKRKSSNLPLGTMLVVGRVSFSNSKPHGCGRVCFQRPPFWLVKGNQEEISPILGFGFGGSANLEANPMDI